MARIALALLRTKPPRPRDENAERGPRDHVMDETFERVYDYRILDEAPPALRALYRRLPVWAWLALEIHRRRGEYDAVVSWGERLSFALAAVHRLSRHAKPHAPILYWMNKTNILIPMKLLKDEFPAIITWNSLQRTFGIERLGIPAERFRMVKHFVDTLFWKPLPREEDMICAVGTEMRDYPTLVEALKGTGLRCHIAGDTVRVNRGGFRHEAVPVADLAREAGPGVTAGPLPPLELRELYARSRFVVLPLHEAPTDNGITVMLEAMAMGKPVICSRTSGQGDVIRDGEIGLFVPVGDPAALRNAMLALWNDPERAHAMGERARRYVEEHHRIEKFSRDVRAAGEYALGAAPAGDRPPAPEARTGS